MKGKRMDLTVLMFVIVLCVSVTTLMLIIFQYRDSRVQWKAFLDAWIETDKRVETVEQRLGIVSTRTLRNHEWRHKHFRDHHGEKLA
jgi:hypothetical protein